MNRGEEMNETPKGEQNSQNAFAAANDAANVQDDNQAKPLDKTEGRMNNGELGGGMQEEQAKNKD